MNILLLTKGSKNSGNLLYPGAVDGLKENNVSCREIIIHEAREENPPHWISIPTLSIGAKKPQDNKILNEIRDFRPDHILLLQYSGIPFLLDNGEELREIVGKDGSIGFWMVDLAEKVCENRQLGKYIDNLFLSNAGQLAEYKEKWGVGRAVFMPQGCYVRSGDHKMTKKHEVSFIGRRQREDARYNDRNALLDAIAGKFNLFEPDYEVGLDEVIEIYKNSKIVVGASWKNDVELYSSDRLFNVLGAGGFYACNYFPGIERLFTDKKHLTWFADIQHALEVIGYYLDNDSLRNEIVIQGHELVKEKHTYKARMRNIINILCKNSTDFEGYL